MSISHYDINVCLKGQDMLSSDEADTEILFDAMDYLSPQEADIEIFFDAVDYLSPQDSNLDNEELDYNKFRYEVWVNEPQSVKERRQRFLQEMGLADIYSNVCSHENNTWEIETIMECEGAVTNAHSLPVEANVLFDEHKEDVSIERKVCKLFSPGNEHRQREAKAREENGPLDMGKKRMKNWWKHFVKSSKGMGRKIESTFNREKSMGQKRMKNWWKHFVKSSKGMRGKIKSKFNREKSMGKMKMKNWWKRFVKNSKGMRGKVKSKYNRKKSKTRRINVEQKRKKWREFSALYRGQEIKAHNGLIWTMKFSPNGQYLASGGEDGVVRVWCVISMDTSGICFTTEDITLISEGMQDISCCWKKQSNNSFVVLPNKVLHIEESPLQEFFGHKSDVLDLAWSDSNILLSSSVDKTVRMWQIGCNQCLSVFHHNDYVTCIQVNPVDKNYFISGSIDGKVRIWGLREERVVDWADIRDVITAICYQPDGKGFVVGSITGTCCFYVTSGEHSQLEAVISAHGKKKTVGNKITGIQGFVVGSIMGTCCFYVALGEQSQLEEVICAYGKKKTVGNKITGIQFSQKEHQRVMITYADSTVRIFDGIELIHKFRGLWKSGSQMSGSFTSSEKHIISVGNDSCVYIWNSSDLKNPSSKQIKSDHSCEYFFTEGVTVAIPWSSITTEQRSSGSNFAQHSSEMQHHQVACPGLRDSERLSFDDWLPMDGTHRGSLTLPEDKLPSLDLLFAKDKYNPQQVCKIDAWHERGVLETWGLSIVVAGLDGTIKTFHNFGLPVKLQNNVMTWC